jgi:hypothetical protein
MRLLAPLLVVLALLAGCVSTPPEEPTAPVAAANVTVGDRPDPVFGEVALGPVAAPDLNATLLAAPKLVPGEWWRIRFTSPLTGVDVEFIRVVGAVDGDAYVVGMPHEGWYKEAVVYHTPCFGDVVAADLGCRAHNIPFAAVKFPLTEGATWVTQFERPPDLTATVKVVSPTEAEITYADADGNVHIEAVYDATIHEMRSFKHAIAVWEVVEHGYGFEGWITIPRAEELVFEHGRVGTPATMMNPIGTPAAPVESVEISGGYNRLSFILAVGNALGVDQGGAYRMTATAPDGTVYQMESIPGAPMTIQFFEHKDPDGVWDLEYLAVGPGIAFIEGIAYHQYDIHLPDGAIRSDHSHEVIR